MSRYNPTTDAEKIIEALELIHLSLVGPDAEEPLGDKLTDLIERLTFVDDNHGNLCQNWGEGHFPPVGSIEVLVHTVREGTSRIEAALDRQVEALSRIADAISDRG